MEDDDRLLCLAEVVWQTADARGWKRSSAAVRSPAVHEEMRFDVVLALEVDGSDDVSSVVLVVEAAVDDVVRRDLGRVGSVDEVVQLRQRPNRRESSPQHS